MTKAWMSLCVIATSFFLAACDPTHKEKCEWYLVPEPEQIDLVPAGWVSLCARNYVINKQKCYLKAELEFAKALVNKPFKLSRLKVEETGPYPRSVLKINTCTPEGEEAERLKKVGG